MNDVTTAPSSPVPSQPVVLSFGHAMQAVVEGKKITRQGWENPAVYGFIEEQELRIMLADGTPHRWILSPGDISADDWVIV